MLNDPTLSPVLLGITTGRLGLIVKIYSVELTVVTLTMSNT